MLVLSRKLGQRVRLRVEQPDGGHTDVWLTLVDSRRRDESVAVRLGFHAPSHVQIMREELLREEDDDRPAR